MRENSSADSGLNHPTPEDNDLDANKSDTDDVEVDDFYVTELTAKNFVDVVFRSYTARIMVDREIRPPPDALPSPDLQVHARSRPVRLEGPIRRSFLAFVSAISEFTHLEATLNPLALYLLQQLRGFAAKLLHHLRPGSPEYRVLWGIASLLCRIHAVKLRSYFTVVGDVSDEEYIYSYLLKDSDGCNHYVEPFHVESPEGGIQNLVVDVPWQALNNDQCTNPTLSELPNADNDRGEDDSVDGSDAEYHTGEDTAYDDAGDDAGDGDGDGDGDGEIAMAK
ncbi:hypothetical protein EJ04DRAFT_581262 [Polyplosphaeria fusca]|uniref:Uncharacterized protein n=1 Tax=Polyplosphaeria fusca TaxID=682080 RepID=A0A9P4UX40_9PLEO|nr:hypothetical protein EJ04DRAFT_581262 [Polyplosphaeria fusca]